MVSFKRTDNVVSGVENQLIQDILANYSKIGRPISNISMPVEVSISFYLTQLMSLEEKHQVLTTFGWLETYWQDEYLVWNSSLYGGLEQLVLSPELVWLPDFGVENSAKAIYDELFFKRFRVAISKEGVVNWVPGGKFITSCLLDITYYPFDQQECNIDLVDWAYHGLQVKLVNGSSTIGLDAYTESGEWQILRTMAESGDMYYESDPGVPFPRVRFTIYMLRKPRFYTINIICPCMTMSLLALLVFYLPPDSGEKVSLGMTVLLSFSVFLLLVAENVPKTSESVPLLGIYLTLIMVMTAMSICVCVMVLNIHHRDPNQPVPGWLHRLTHDCLAYTVCMRSHVTPPKYQQGLQQLCNFSQGYAREFAAPPAADRGESNSFQANDTDSLPPADVPNHQMPSFEDNGLGESVAMLVKTAGKKKAMLQEIVKHLRTITSKLKEKEDENVIQTQWKTVALILDRFFLVVFIVIVVGSSLFCLILYPKIGQQNLWEKNDTDEPDHWWP